MEMFFEHFHFHICHLFIENNLHNIRILQKSFNMLHLTKERGERVCNARWVHMACPACFPPSASSRRCRSQEGQLELVASQKQAKPRYSPFPKKSCTHIKYYLVKLNCNCFNKLPHSQRIGAYRNGKKNQRSNLLKSRVQRKRWRGHGRFIIAANVQDLALLRLRAKGRRKLIM